MGCGMPLKIHFLDSHVYFFPENLGTVSRERFHPDISDVEKRYQGFWNNSTLVDHYWTLYHDQPAQGHRRKSKLRHFRLCCTAIQCTKRTNRDLLAEQGQKKPCQHHFHCQFLWSHKFLNIFMERRGSMITGACMDDNGILRTAGLMWSSKSAVLAPWLERILSVNCWYFQIINIFDQESPITVKTFFLAFPSLFYSVKIKVVSRRINLIKDFDLGKN